jgi:hypothetical protein
MNDNKELEIAYYDLLQLLYDMGLRPQCLTIKVSDSRYKIEEIRFMGELVWNTKKDNNRLDYSAYGQSDCFRYLKKQIKKILTETIEKRLA